MDHGLEKSLRETISDPEKRRVTDKCGIYIYVAYTCMCVCVCVSVYVIYIYTSQLSSSRLL